MKPFIDTHGRQIKYLRMSITDRCNLRCRYCMPATGVEWIPHQKVMTYEEYLRVVRICLSRGVEKIRITGGEPLVRRGIVDFIRDLRQLEGLKDLSLTTNGMLLSSMAGELRKAGLQRLNISLDTLKKDKFAHITRVDGFDRVIAGIRRAAEEGFSPIKINVVAMLGFNDMEIPDFAALTQRYDADIRFIELMPMGCANRFGEYEVINATEIRAIIEERFGPLEDVDYRQGPATVAKIRGARVG
jgi:cyclic pyranopterin phosphate synthase